MMLLHCCSVAAAPIGAAELPSHLEAHAGVVPTTAMGDLDPARNSVMKAQQKQVLLFLSLAQLLSLQPYVQPFLCPLDRQSLCGIFSWSVNGVKASSNGNSSMGGANPVNSNADMHVMVAHQTVHDATLSTSEDTGAIAG